MKKRFIASIAVALVATSAGALADDAVSGGQSGQQQPATTTPTTTPTSTTTVTAAGVDESTPPVLQTSPKTRADADTVVLYQNTRPNKPILFTGGALLLGSYVPTAVFTATEDLDRILYVPIAGPWLHLADRPDDADNTETVLIVGSGIIQGAGAILTAASFFLPEKVPAATIQAGNMKFHVTPMANGRGTAGVGAFARF